MKKLLIIQEHNADKAGFHWDIRFESSGELDSYIHKRNNNSSEPMNTSSEKVLRSFCIPKHRLPNDNERLLCIPTEDHPWEYKDFDGVIKSGYGAGDVKLLFNDYIEVPVFNESKIEFIYNNIRYKMFAFKDKFLITKLK